MMPLVFSIGHALAKILGHTSSMTMDILHCGIHDQFEVKPTIVNGRKTYKCLQCESGLARSDRGRVRTQGPLSPPEPDKDEVQISRVGTQGPLSPEPDIDEVRGGKVGTQGPLSPPEPDNDEVQARVPSGATPFLTRPVLRRPSAARMMHTENKLVQLTNVNPQDQAFVISFLA